MSSYSQLTSPSPSSTQHTAHQQGAAAGDRPTLRRLGNFDPVVLDMMDLGQEIATQTGSVTVKWWARGEFGVDASSSPEKPKSEHSHSDESMASVIERVSALNLHDTSANSQVTQYFNKKKGNGRHDHPGMVRKHHVKSVSQRMSNPSSSSSTKITDFFPKKRST